MLRSAAVKNNGLVTRLSWSTVEMIEIVRALGPDRSFCLAGGCGPFNNLEHPFVVYHDILA